MKYDISNFQLPKIKIKDNFEKQLKMSGKKCRKP